MVVISPAAPPRGVSIGRQIATLLLCLFVVFWWVVIIYWNELVSVGIFGAASDGTIGVAPGGWGLGAYLPGLLLAGLLSHRQFVILITAVGQLAFTLSIELSVGRAFALDSLIAVASVVLVAMAAAWIVSGADRKQQFDLSRVFGALAAGGFSAFVLSPADTFMWMIAIALCAWGCRPVRPTPRKIALALLVAALSIAASCGAVLPMAA